MSWFGRKRVIFSQKSLNGHRWRWTHVGLRQMMFLGKAHQEQCLGWVNVGRPLPNKEQTACKAIIWAEDGCRGSGHLETTQDPRQGGGCNWKHTLSPDYLFWHKSMTSHCLLQQPKQPRFLTKLKWHPMMIIGVNWHNFSLFVGSGCTLTQIKSELMERAKQNCCRRPRKTNAYVLLRQGPTKISHVGLCFSKMQHFP